MVKFRTKAEAEAYMKGMERGYIDAKRVIEHQLNYLRELDFPGRYMEEQK